MLDLVAEISGATATYPFGHLVRTEDGSDFNTAYARFVHCDYNERSLTRMAARHPRSTSRRARAGLGLRLLQHLATVRS